MAIIEKITDDVRQVIKSRLHMLGNESGPGELGIIPRSLVGIKTNMLDKITELRNEVAALVASGHPSVEQADVTEIDKLYAKMVQNIKDWANAL